MPLARSEMYMRWPGIHAFPERAYEAGGGGAAWRRDAGRTWKPADKGRDRHYTWELAVDSDDPDLWYISACPSARHAHSGQNAEAHLYRWSGAGPWKQVGRGLPQPLTSMPYALITNRGWVFVGLADGRIFASNDKGENWSSLHVLGPTLHSLKAFASPG